jgi:hypothetical protein
MGGQQDARSSISLSRRFYAKRIRKTELSAADAIAVLFKGG